MDSDIGLQDIGSVVARDPFESFICPLSKKMMTDPVAIHCGHSFERAAIEEHFSLGEKKCPECRQELTSMELTSNLWLRSSIEEWKQRDMDIKFQAAVYGLKSSDQSRKNKALEDMKCLMEMPQYAIKVVDEGLTSTFVETIRDNSLNVGAALKCLYYLAKYNDNQKEAIVEAGAIRRIVQHIYRGGKESDAISVLLELSENEIFGEKIGNTKDCIPFLVSLLQNNNSEVSQKAQKVLKNLSSNTHFVVKMAEAGYFQPFVVSFNQGSHETRAWMATAFINMELKENNIKVLKDKEFTDCLIQMLFSSFPACKIAGLKSIKKLVAYPKMVKRLLKNHVTIPYLLDLISYAGSDASLKQEAAEVLALLIEGSQDLEREENQGLQELQSKHIVSLFLQIVATSDDQTKIQFFHLLTELSYKSKTARNLIQSDEDAIRNLFFSLHSDCPMIKRWAMKLIYCLSEGDSYGVPLPSSSAKETAVNTLVSILISSPDVEERSIAAGIISRLPGDDIVVDEILRKSEALKAIHEVICSMDEENSENISPANPNTSLLENVLAALLRYTEPTKPELQKQLGKLELYPALVRVLSRGSSTAKQQTAIALAQLSRSTSMSISNGANKNEHTKPLLDVMKIFPWCCSSSLEYETLCSVHGSACSPRDTFCLVKADAVKPLVRALSETESGAAEAALMALETLLTDHSTLLRAISAIVENQGVVAILKVLEKGTISAKIKALNLFQEILKHAQIDQSMIEISQRILIQFLQDDSLKKRAAQVLSQMDAIPYQSSYF